MLKVIFLIQRKAGMNAESFREYWTKTHAPIAARLPGLRR